MSLTRISAATAFLAAVLNAAVLLGWSLDGDQVAAINGAIVAAGALVHSWFNPNVGIGRTD